MVYQNFSDKHMHKSVESIKNITHRNQHFLIFWSADIKQDKQEKRNNMHQHSRTKLRNNAHHMNKCITL